MPGLADHERLLKLRLERAGRLPAPNSCASSAYRLSTAPRLSASSGVIPTTRTFGELLIDLEEEAARAVIFGLLADMEGK